MDPSSNIPPGVLPHKKHEGARRILFYGCCLKSPPPPYKAPILKRHISPDIFFSQVNTLKGISKVPAAVDLLRLDTLRGPTFLTPTRYDEHPYPFYMGAPPPTSPREHTHSISPTFTTCTNPIIPFILGVICIKTMDILFIEA